MDNEEPSNGSIQKSASTNCELGSENGPKWNEMSLEGGFLDEENGGGIEEDGGIAVGLGEGLGGLKRIGRSFAERLAARTGGDSPRLNTARFKTVPPSSLPIARSPSLTIPPGLSPTTLLDSPVLLSNSLDEYWMWSVCLSFLMRRRICISRALELENLIGFLQGRLWRY